MRRPTFYSTESGWLDAIWAPAPFFRASSGRAEQRSLLLTGRALTADEGLAWGYYNEVVPASELMSVAYQWASRLSAGPTFANAMTKNQLNLEWDISLDTAIEAEAQAQAICMQTADFERAYLAFVDKEKPLFEGD